MAVPMQRLAAAMSDKRGKGTKVEMRLVHRAPKAAIGTRALAPSVQATSWQDFLDETPLFRS
jgi:hypothetical protein